MVRGRRRSERPRRGGRSRRGGGGRRPAIELDIPEGAVAARETEALPEVAYLDRLTPARTEQLQAFSDEHALKVGDLNLLNRAFSHKSYTNEIGLPHNEQNEKLEFFGDGVLGLVVNEHLFRRFPDAEEGDLAKIKSAVVSEATLSEVARRLRLDRYILLGRGEEASGGRHRAGLLADCLEAVIGATYLSAGLDAARAFVLHFIEEEVGRATTDEGASDFKSLLQEHAQRVWRVRPSYRLLRTVGPEHSKEFRIEVHAGSRRATGTGRSKKEAEQAAAEALYRRNVGRDREGSERPPREDRFDRGRRLEPRPESSAPAADEATPAEPVAEATAGEAAAEAVDDAASDRLPGFEEPTGWPPDAEAPAGSPEDERAPVVDRSTADAPAEAGDGTPATEEAPSDEAPKEEAAPARRRGRGRRGGRGRGRGRR